MRRRCAVVSSVAIPAHQQEKAERLEEAVQENNMRVFAVIAFLALVSSTIPFTNKHFLCTVFRNS